ncbi:hypothetical protein SUGI_1113620 [Cryptomeria japonica]|nr:hypothetical protein SUGI_1113620 [Cryptomeria japonica]
MASKAVMLFTLCVFAVFLLQSSVSATATDALFGENKALEGPAVPDLQKHYVGDCKRCCYLDEYSCLSCCGKGQQLVD